MHQNTQKIKINEEEDEAAEELKKCFRGWNFHEKHGEDTKIQTENDNCIKAWRCMIEGYYYIGMEKETTSIQERNSSAKYNG